MSVCVSVCGWINKQRWSQPASSDKESKDEDRENKEVGSPLFSNPG